MNESPEPQSFEEALAELQKIVELLDDGATTLEDALSNYERGVGLLKFCYGRLKKAEQKIVQLTGVDESGQPILEPFEHTGTKRDR